MSDAIAHRGPDDEGVYLSPDGAWCACHRRLSIIDLSSAGHQPMWNAQKTLAIVFNGEIYNYKEIKDELRGLGYEFHTDTDTEVIILAYERWGQKCLEKFNGMFAFAIADTVRNEFFLARDRQGIKPLYYCDINNKVFFASEIKALFASGLVAKEPDYAALTTPTRFQIGENTGFKNIKKLQPGCFLTVKNNTTKITRYWNINPNEVDMDIKEAEERLTALLEDSVRLQMVADVPVGIFLSGGLDSSIIAALMRKNTTEEIQSFTIKFSEDDQKFEKTVNDSYYAKIIAKEFDFKHYEFEINPDIVSLLPKMVYHLDEPLADPAAINTYLMSKTARENGIIVVLNGIGGDEIFGGYRKHLACLYAEYYQRFVLEEFRNVLEGSMERIPVANKTVGFKYLRWMKRYFSFASMPQLERFITSDLSFPKKLYQELYPGAVPYEETGYYLQQKANFTDKSLSYLTKMCLNDTKVFLPDHNLTYTDKASMAASIEGRPPLTDHRIIEFMFSLPPKFRINKGVQKFLLKKVSEKYIPKEVIYRPKAPFGSPLRSWIRGPLQEMINDQLSESQIKKWGVLDYKTVKDLIDKDRAGVEDNAHYIWQFLTLQVWFDVFFRN